MRNISVRRMAAAILIIPAVDASAEVCLYQHDDYRGGRACFDKDVRDFGRVGINDQVSSVRIHGDYSVTLYTDSDFRGDSDTYDHDVSHVGRRFNDKFSSMEIHRRDEYRGWGRESNSGWNQSGWDDSQRFSRHSPRGEVCLYKDWNYQGEEKCFTHDVTDLRAFGFDNQADSIRISGDVEAILYEHHDYHGHNRRFFGDNPKFTGGDHDTYSSLRIRRKH